MKYQPFISRLFRRSRNRESSMVVDHVVVTKVDRKPKPSINDPLHTQLKKETDLQQQAREAGL